MSYVTFQWNSKIWSLITDLIDALCREIKIKVT